MKNKIILTNLSNEDINNFSMGLTALLKDNATLKKQVINFLNVIKVLQVLNDYNKKYVYSEDNNNNTYSINFYKIFYDTHFFQDALNNQNITNELNTLLSRYLQERCLNLYDIDNVESFKDLVSIDLSKCDLDEEDGSFADWKRLQKIVIVLNNAIRLNTLIANLTQTFFLKQNVLCNYFYGFYNDENNNGAKFSLINIDDINKYLDNLPYNHFQLTYFINNFNLLNLISLKDEAYINESYIYRHNDLNNDEIWTNENTFNDYETTTDLNYNCFFNISYAILKNNKFINELLKIYANELIDLN